MSSLSLSCLLLQDAEKPNQLTRNAAQNIVNGRWSMPPEVQVSQNCLDLVGAIFTKDTKAGFLNTACALVALCECMLL